MLHFWGTNLAASWESCSISVPTLAFLATTGAEVVGIHVLCLASCPYSLVLLHNPGRPGTQGLNNLYNESHQLCLTPTACSWLTTSVSSSVPKCCSLTHLPPPHSSLRLASLAFWFQCGKLLADSEKELSKRRENIIQVNTRKPL